MPLRLLPQPGAGQDPPKRRKRPSDALVLSDEEVRHVRQALRNLAFALGGNDVTAHVLGIAVKSITSAKNSPKHRPSGTLAIRIAKAAGVSVESILTGAIAITARCPTCGRRGTS